MGEAAKTMLVTLHVDELERIVEKAVSRALTANANATPVDIIMLNTRQAAKLLNTSTRNMRYLIERGLPAQRLGKDYRFARHDVLAWAGRMNKPSEAAE